MKIKLQNVRCSFPDLFDTAKYEGVDTGKYAITLILDKEKHANSIKEIKENTASLIKNKLQLSKLPADKICLRDGDEMEHDHYNGSYILRAKSIKKPVGPDEAFSMMSHFLVIGKDKRVLTKNDNKFYGGCYVNACIDLYASSKYKLILAGLLGVQFEADGEPFGDVTKFGLDDFDATEEPGALKDATDDFF